MFEGVCVFEDVYVFEDVGESELMYMRGNGWLVD